jgi:tripartite-type tricarboxylate transporter receptor subunit TctC
MFITAALPAPAFSQTAWPTKPVKIVVPFGAGGAADAASRILNDRLSQSLGQSFIIENRPGAGQNIGTDAVVRSAPDGYTFLWVSEVIVVEHLLDKEVRFVVLRDLTPVARAAGSGTILISPASFPAKTLAEFLAEVKANPGKYNFANVNNFELPEMVDFRDRLGLKMVIVPYKNGPAAVQAIATGDAHIFAAAVNDTATFMPGGKIRALAYTGKTPHSQFPNVPTVAGSNIPGLTDFESIFAFTLFAPAGTPTDIVNKLHGAVSEAVHNPDVIARYRTMGLETYDTPIPELQASLAAKVKQIESMLARGLKLR